MLVGISVLNCGPSEDPKPTYTVKRGDTLFLIGKAHGVTVDDLKKWNKLDSDLIEVGQPLIVGDGPATPSPRPAPTKPVTSRKSTTSASTGNALRMPEAKPCLAGPKAEELESDEGYTGSKGLEPQAIKTALDSFLPNINECLMSADPTPTTGLVLDFPRCSGFPRMFHDFLRIS